MAQIQVMIYQHALPLALPQYRNAKIGGEVVYPDHTERVPRGTLPNQFIEEVGSLIRRLASDVPPKRVPNATECRFCGITSIDCPDRLEAAPDLEDATTDDF